MFRKGELRFEQEKSFKFFQLLSVVLALLLTASCLTWAQAQTLNRINSKIEHSITSTGSVYFTTDVQDQTPLALFNLLRFKGESPAWEQAEVEIKYKLNEPDLLLAKRFEFISRENSGQQTDLLFPSTDYHSIGRLSSREELAKPRWIIWLPSSSPQPSPKEQSALRQLLKSLQAHAHVVNPPSR